jgi:hypothetical protein
MRTITIFLENNKPVYDLSVDVSTDDYKFYKLNYKYSLEKILTRLIKGESTKEVIHLDTLPVLSDSLEKLKEFIMRSEKTISIIEWNERREAAKNYFTFPVICELDASGLIKKIVR